MRIRQAQIEEASALNGKNDMVLQMKRDAAAAWHRYLQTKSSVVADMQSVDHYRAYVAGAEQEFNIGTKTLTDLLQAKVAYEGAKTSVIQDKAALVLAKLNMKYLLGQIKSVNFIKLVEPNSNKPQHDVKAKSLVSIES